MDIKYVNLTPHPIVLHAEHGFGQTEITTFPPSGQVARAAERRVDVGGLGYARVERVEYGRVEGLPAVQPNVYLIVSGLVLAAAPDRPDLLAPGRQIRDDAGNIIGCKGWTCTPAFKTPEYVIDRSHSTPEAGRAAWLASQQAAREEEIRQHAAKNAAYERKMRDD